MKSFKEIIKSPLTEWDTASISQLSNRQIEALCILLGIPKSGNKSQKIERLTHTIVVRIILDKYLQEFRTTKDAATVLAHEYKVRELRGLCKKVKCFHSKLTTKYSIATSLFNWRTGCISRGREAYQQVKAELAKRPRQLSLF